MAKAWTVEALAFDAVIGVLAEEIFVIHAVGLAATVGLVARTACLKRVAYVRYTAAELRDAGLAYLA